MNNKTNNNISLYVLSFFMYCIIGWIFEVIQEYSIGHGFVNRGFLYGPYLPIYGFGVIILILTQRNIILKKIKINGINVTPIVVFLLSFFIVSLIEYLSSYILEIIFHRRWWDYSLERFNLNGRIFLRNCLLFALGGTLAIYFFQPFLEKVLKKIDLKKIKTISSIIIIIMLIDFFVTIVGYFN